MKASTRLFNALANAAKSSASAWAAVANAHATLATLCGMQASTHVFAALANATKAARLHEPPSQTPTLR